MFRALLISITFSLLSLSVFQPSFADVPSETKMIYYDVEAENLKALRVNIFKVTPIREDGNPFAGHTQNKWTWNISWLEQGESCHITDVTIDIKTIITLPRWTSARRAENAEYKEWRRYSKALLAHEKQHQSIGLKTVADIKRTLEALRPARTCERLFANAKKAARDIEIERQAEQDAFDAHTDHGATQGVQFK